MTSDTDTENSGFDYLDRHTHSTFARALRNPTTIKECNETFVYFTEYQDRALYIDKHGLPGTIDSDNDDEDEDSDSIGSGSDDLEKDNHEDWLAEKGDTYIESDTDDDISEGRAYAGQSDESGFGGSTDAGEYEECRYD